jgi:hypothetical protein
VHALKRRKIELDAGFRSEGEGGDVSEAPPRQQRLHDVEDEGG